MEIVTRWFYDDDAKILCKKQGVITDKGEFEYGNNAYDFSIEKGYHFATKSEAILDAVKDIDADIEVLQRRKRFLLEQMEEYNAKTLPEPFTYIGSSAFEKLSSGYAVSVFCSKHAMTNRDIPLYAEPTANKPLPEPIKMTNARPASTGWYWYELPGSWPLQPVLVFDGGPGYGLMYALDKIDLDHDDGNRDGFCIDICEVNSLWSTRPIESPNKEVAIGAEK